MFNLIEVIYNVYIDLNVILVFYNMYTFLKIIWNWGLS